jgi:hypothetical protein
MEEKTRQGFLDELSESCSLAYITDNTYVTHTNKGDK